ncbi:MAG: hypothetical protein H5U40_09700, partial [Polyangiaceae bacterium]|nr:hypothetical protein [Polyangiaceae bacterium]
MSYRHASLAISTGVALLLGISLGGYSAANAQPPLVPTATAEGRSLTVETPDGAHVVPLPCDARALFVLADRAYVACGASGVVVVRLFPETPIVEAVLTVGGEAVGFFAHGERVWVEVTQTMAQPLDQLGIRAAPSAAALAIPSPSPAPTTGEVPPPPPPSRPPSDLVGRVVRVDSGTVIVDLGAADGLSIGSRVAFQAVTPGASEDDRLEEEPVTIGEVVGISEGRARVRLGFGETAAEGAIVRRVDAGLSRSRVAPPRIAGWTVGFTVRPTL